MGDRTLILVRHGQYHLDLDHPRHGRLTPLGERQSKCVGKRLAGYNFDAVHSSTAPRAVETATLIAEQLARRTPIKRSSLLLEGIPTPFEGISRQQRTRIPRDRARMERAFERYFRPTRGKDRVELLVCHGNISRFLLRRALNDAPGKWWQAAVMHCGLCIIVIRGSGAARVYALNDAGHLPRTMQTFS